MKPSLKLAEPIFLTPTLFIGIPVGNANRASYLPYKVLLNYTETALKICLCENVIGQNNTVRTALLSAIKDKDVIQKISILKLVFMP